MKNQKRPILFIHGFGGSKLIQKSNTTQKEQICWIKPSLDAENHVVKYLWGQFNPESISYRSFVSDHVAIKPKGGIGGCDYLVEMLLYKQASNQFGSLVKHFESKGYKLDEDVFAFTYDWRQPLNNTQIQESLHDQIQLIYHQTKSQIQIVTHSMGGLLVETYMKLHKHWGTFIAKFVAIACPFDGTSAVVNVSQIFGYNMGLPIKQCTLKGVQATCGSLPFVMHSSKTQNGQQGIVLMKKIKTSSKANNEVHYYKRENILASSAHSSTFSLSKGQEEQTVNQQFSLENVILNPHVYGTETPDLFFIVAQQIIENPGLILPQNWELTFNILQCGCRNGAIQINNRCATKELARQQVVEIVEPVFQNGFLELSDIDLDEDQDFEWEAYCAHAHSAEYGSSLKKFREYYKPNQYFNIDENNTLHFTKRFYKILRNKQLAQQQQCWNLFKDIKQYYQALQYYIELHDKQLKFRNSRRFKECCKSPMCIQKLDEMPWINPRKMLQLKLQPLVQLSQKVHTPGTLTNVLFGTDVRTYQNAAQVQDLPIEFNECKGFSFTSISGTGIDTAFHAFYSKPVRQYDELLHQVPEFTYQQGDGTVLITSALSDPFPDELVGDRVVIPGLSHFAMLQDKKLYDILDEVLEYE